MTTLERQPRRLERPAPRRPLGRGVARALGRGLDAALDPAAARLWSWVGPLLVAAVAAVLRFVDLGRPHQLVFDETYYVKQAYSLLQVGYELRWPEGADEQFTAGSPDVFSTEADYPVHPPVAKWMIAAGIALFGVESSFGWRSSTAVVGTLMVFLTARIGRRLLGSTLLGCTAGLLLAVDGLHLVHSRTSLLDLPLALWVLAAFGCLLVDRDAHRARVLGGAAAAGGRLARLRPWRLGAAVCLGLACGVKWSGLYVVAAFCVMTVLWDLGARRAAGQTRLLPRFVADAAVAAVVVLPVVLGVYLASWVGWFRSESAHLRQWAAEDPDRGVGWLPPALRSLWHYHQEMYSFHVGLTSDHTYQSNPWSWLVQGRPTSFFYEGPARGVDGCAVDQCSKAITSVGNPVVWWAGAASLLVLLFCWALRRDWRAGAILAGVAAGYLPWFAYQERTIFTFYAIVFTPFLVLGLTYALGLVLGPPTASPARRARGAVAAGAVVVAAVLVAAWFLPVWTAQVVPYDAWRMRMWFTSWI